ncbi:hypothetical protein RFI_06184 [Reticulomyxa filosa]|uniref:6-phosphofructo-2-kinase domain-containing protein n=1 Tax=Reticulomyxa filosa TaxID=46433 RepID=X6NYI5_RETFI|nr:hypothetical protein RFI_06184 [Reticulomyxa filosa]|eukprot:ETO30938.1 hypothetical protein RFI_06184 [Reticulomyxa filosa]
MNLTSNDQGEIYSYSEDNSKLLIVMVGLPARGKTFIAKKISSYLSWVGIRTKSFNLDAYRRAYAKDMLGKPSATFFDPTNENGVKQREAFAKVALKDLTKFFVQRRTSGDFGRSKHNSKAKTNDTKLECRDEKLIEQNISKVLDSPDYAHMASQEAVKDFKQRIAYYEKAFEDVKEDEGSFIKLIDAGKYVIGHMIRGYLPARILYFLMHINLKRKTIFLTRHGESEFDVSGKIGGDSPLTILGKTYAEEMAEWVSKQPEFGDKDDRMRIWCSAMKPAMQTADIVKKYDSDLVIYQWKALNDLDGGVCEGKTHGDIKKEMPKDYAARVKDKLSYRFPQGESYKDVIQRLEPVVFELERSTQPILVIAHTAVLRCLYSYFMESPVQSIPNLDISLHTLYKLSPGDYKTEVERFIFDIKVNKTKDDVSSK